MTRLALDACWYQPDAVAPGDWRWCCGVCGHEGRARTDVAGWAALALHVHEGCTLPLSS